MVVFVIFIICPLWRPRGISKVVSGLYYITRDTDCNIHIGAKLYSLGRAKVFSSIAINFGLKIILPYATTKHCHTNKTVPCENLFICIVLWLNVPVNNYGHVETVS